MAAVFLQLQPQQAQRRARPRHRRRPHRPEVPCRHRRRRRAQHAPRRGAALRRRPGTLTAGHPELVHSAIVGFGADGPYADLPAYDDIVQAVSGIAGAQEWMAGAPTYVANAVADKIAGLTAAFAIAAALRKRAVDGSGSAIEVPMAERSPRSGWSSTCGVAPSCPRGRGALPADVVAGPPAVPDRRRSPRGRGLHRPRLAALLRHHRPARSRRRRPIRHAARPHAAARRALHVGGRAPCPRHDPGVVRAPHRRGDPGRPLQPGRRPVRRPALRRRRAVGGDRTPVGGQPAAVPDADHLRRRARGLGRPAPGSAPTAAAGRSTTSHHRAERGPVDDDLATAPLVARHVGRDRRVVVACHRTAGRRASSRAPPRSAARPARGRRCSRRRRRPRGGRT